MRVSTMTVYRLIKAGELPAIRVGKHLRIRERDVAKYLDERIVGTIDRRRDRGGDRRMARRLIGLDIGTNAVRVAELELSDPPRLTSFGQVALPPGAMRDGEVVDPAAVTAAIQRLWKELSLKKAPVRVGVASPRRARAHRRPADDVGRRARRRPAIPGSGPDPDPARGRRPRLPGARVAAGARGRWATARRPQPMSRVLLAAAHKDLILNLTGAVRAAGLSVAAVDLVPLALVRSVGRRVSDNGGGVEAIVEHRRRRDRRRRPRARHPALRPHPRLGRPLGHRRGRPRPRAHHRSGRSGQAADGHRAGRSRRARAARDGATDLGSRRAGPRLARLLPHAARLDPSAQGHAHRRWRAHPRARRPARRHRRRARRPGTAA